MIITRVNFATNTSAYDPETGEYFTLDALVAHANALEEQVDKLQEHAKELEAENTKLRDNPFSSVSDLVAVCISVPTANGPRFAIAMEAPTPGSFTGPALRAFKIAKENMDALLVSAALGLDGDAKIAELEADLAAIESTGITLQRVDGKVTSLIVPTFAPKARGVRVPINTVMNHIAAGAAGAESCASRTRSSATSPTRAGTTGRRRGDEPVAISNLGTLCGAQPAPVPPSPEARLVAVYRELLELGVDQYHVATLAETAAFDAARVLAPVVAPLLLAKKAA